MYKKIFGLYTKKIFLLYMKKMPFLHKKQILSKKKIVHCAG